MRGDWCLQRSAGQPRLQIGSVVLFSAINLLDHRAKTYFANFLISLQDENNLTHDDVVNKARIICAAGLFNQLDCRFQLRWLDSYLLRLPACPVLRPCLKPNAPIIGSSRANRPWRSLAADQWHPAHPRLRGANQYPATRKNPLSLHHAQYLENSASDR